MAAFCLLTGCAGRNQTGPQAVTKEMITLIQGDFSVYADILWEDIEEKAVITRQGENLKFQFYAPEAVNGLSVSLSGEELAIEMLGLSSQGSKNLLPKNSPILFLQKLLSELSADGLNFTEKEDGLLIETASGCLLLTAAADGFVSFCSKERDIQILVTAE